MESGEVVAGRLVRLAARRHLRDLIDGPKRGLTWSPEHAQHAIDFFAELLVLPDGEHAGKPFILLPFGEFIIGSLFGWLNAEGYRRFRTAFVETGKGAIKTPIAAGVGLYMLCGDGVDGARIFCAANSRSQASLTFRDATRIASPALVRTLEILNSVSGTTYNILHRPSGSYLRPVSAQAKNLEGERVHCAVIDELQEHPNDHVVNVMSAGVKADRSSLIFEILNAGRDLDSVAWEHHDKSVRVLEGAIDDDEWFAYVCQLDVCEPCRAVGRIQPQDGCRACDQWTDERVWIKTNPALPHTPGYSYLRAQVTAALQMPSKLGEVKRKSFCIWTQFLSDWFPPEKWLACGADVSDADLIGAPCFGGLDLGQNDDLTAFARVWLLADGRVAVKMRYWAPKSSLARFPNRQWGQWLDTGLLKLTEGDAVDYGLVEREVGELCLDSGVRELAYDHRFAKQMAQGLEGLGIKAVDTPQGFQLSEALHKIESLVVERKLCHGGDPILTNHISNVILRHGQQEQIRIEKDEKKPEKKVDGVDAFGMALSRAIVAPVENPADYEAPGALVML